MEIQQFGDGRTAVRFGSHKINLHGPDDDIQPRAACPMRGSADICLIAGIPIVEVIEHLETQDVPIEVGPDTRTGALGPITSVYVRDPDRNLIEISVYQ